MSLNWIEVLNEQAEWAGSDQVRGWLATQLCKPINVSDDSITRFESVLHFIRDQATKLHFESTIDYGALNVRLRSIGLQFAPPSHLPALRAAPHPDADEDLVLGLEETLLLQFAFFASQSLEDSKPRLARCEGIYREHNPHVLQSVFSSPS